MGRILHLCIAPLGWATVALVEDLLFQLMARTTRRGCRPFISGYPMKLCKQKTRVHRFPPDEKFFPHLGEQVWWPRVTLSFLFIRNKYAMVLRPEVALLPNLLNKYAMIRG